MRALFAGAVGFLALSSDPAFAQAPARDAYEIKPLRWEEDYSWLAARERPADVPAFKYIPLGATGSYASLGSEVRYRLEAYDEPLFGRFGIQDFTSSAWRFLVHADVHVSPELRVFVQLGSPDEQGREPDARPTDESALDLTQGFVDLGSQTFQVRIGRQELPFGRFLSLRDGTNLRRTFDGVRLSGHSDDLRWDGFIAHPTRNGPDAFDDATDQDDLAWGAAASRGDLTLTYFGRRDDRARYAAGSGVERRHTIAVRTQGENGPWRWDAQVGVQFGTLETSRRDLDIRAFGFASEVSRGFDHPWRPRLALRVDMAGGDDDPGDGELGAFDLGYPNLSYLSDAAAIAPRNVFDVHPFLTVQPTAALTLTGGVELVWRLEQGDALYAPPSLALTAPGSAGGSFAAAQWYGRLTYRPNRHWEFGLSAVRIEPGPALTRSGGRAQTFAAVQSSLRY